MKAPPFCYHRPSSEREVLEMLGTLEGAKLIAGGQSLVPMLNMRYAHVDNLIDINQVPGLNVIEGSDNSVRIGAMARQRAILENLELRRRVPVIGDALQFVGHLHTRNRGTIGGSLTHMDPTAELLCIASLLDATVHIKGRRGARDVEIGDFPLAFMTPCLEQDEMLSAVTLRLPPEGHGWSFQEFSQRRGDFAIVAVAVSLCIRHDSGTVTEARVALSGLDFAPRRLTAVELPLMGQRPAASLIAEVADLAGEEEASSDAIASGGYRRHLARVLTRRAITEAAGKARGEVS